MVPINYNIKSVDHECVVCNKPSELRCAGCKRHYYCGKPHQIQHWKAGHKQVCGDKETQLIEQKQQHMNIVKSSNVICSVDPKTQYICVDICSMFIPHTSFHEFQPAAQAIIPKDTRYLAIASASQFNGSLYANLSDESQKIEQKHVATDPVGKIVYSGSWINVDNESQIQPIVKCDSPYLHINRRFGIVIAVQHKTTVWIAVDPDYQVVPDQTTTATTSTEKTEQTTNKSHVDSSTLSRQYMRRHPTVPHWLRKSNHNTSTKRDNDSDDIDNDDHNIWSQDLINIAVSNLPKSEVEHAKTSMQLMGEHACRMSDEQLRFAIATNRINNKICNYCLKKNTKTLSKLYSCKCYLTWYCSDECQRLDLPKHQTWCCNPNATPDDGPMKIAFARVGHS